MKQYFLAKLSDLNFRMAIHDGDANRRLTSEIDKLLILKESPVPERFKIGFDKLQKLIEDTLSKMSEPGLRPSKFHSIRSRTATKYIEILIGIENQWKEDLEG